MANSRPLQISKLVGVDHWAYTNVDLVKCRYVWVIKNPGYFCNKLESPVFAAKQNEHNVKWQLIVEWNSSSCKLILSLKLISADDEYVRFEYDVSVGDCDGNLKEAFGCDLYTGKPGHVQFGEFPFTSGELRSVPNNVLKDKMLTIVVNITMLNSIQQQTGMVTSESDKCTLIEDLGKLFDDLEFSDVTIIVGNSKFPVHKNILASRSDVFAAMFRHELEEKKTNQIIITDIDSSVIREMLRYIYKGKSSKISEMAGELLQAAEKYALHDLKEACISELYSNMSTETAVQALIFADLHSVQQLKRQAIDFINAHSTSIFKTDTFREMVHNYPHIAVDIFERQESSG